MNRWLLFCFIMLAICSCICTEEMGDYYSDNLIKERRIIIEGNITTIVFEQGFNYNKPIEAIRVNNNSELGDTIDLAFYISAGLYYQNIDSVIDQHFIYTISQDTLHLKYDFYDFTQIDNTNPLVLAKSVGCAYQDGLAKEQVNTVACSYSKNKIGIDSIVIDLDSSANIYLIIANN